MYSGTGVCAGHAHWQSTTLWKCRGSPISVARITSPERRGREKRGPDRPPARNSPRSPLAVDPAFIGECSAEPTLVGGIRHNPTAGRVFSATMPAPGAPLVRGARPGPGQVAPQQLEE